MLNRQRLPMGRFLPEPWPTTMPPRKTSKKVKQLPSPIPSSDGHPSPSQAQSSVSNGTVLTARSKSLQILCDQLMHTRENLTQLEQDPGAKWLQNVPEFSSKTIVCCEPNWARVLVFSVPIKSSPMVVWILRSRKVQVAGHSQALQTRERTTATRLVLDSSAQ